MSTLTTRRIFSILPLNAAAHTTRILSALRSDGVASAVSVIESVLPDLECRLTRLGAPEAIADYPAKIRQLIATARSDKASGPGDVAGSGMTAITAVVHLMEEIETAEWQHRADARLAHQAMVPGVRHALNANVALAG